MIKKKSDLKDYRDVRNILSIDPSTSKILMMLLILRN